LICELCRHDNPQENRFCGIVRHALKTALFKSKSEPAYNAQGDSSQSPARGESMPHLPAHISRVTHSWCNLLPGFRGRGVWTLPSLVSVEMEPKQ